MLPTQLLIKNHSYRLPIFCPDATRGVVKGLDSQDLQAAQVRGIIVNTWHLHQQVGAAQMIDFGGIKSLMNYPGLVISDSGGFQVFSLFQKIPGFGKITDEGLVTYTGPKKQTKILFTPEDSIAMQFAIGSDIIICLDDYTPPDGSPDRQKESVMRTIDWARRCRVAFDQQVERRQLRPDEKPLLFAVIQGHDDLSLRRYCAEQLQEIGFDGYGLGGQKFLPSGKLDLDWTAFNASLTPDCFPRYALGFGKPDDIVALIKQGYTIFDTVLPTRDARHGRIYIADPTHLYHTLHLSQAKYSADERPLDVTCHCHTCRHYSRRYLHHLLRLKDTSFARLATIHNLYFYQQLCR